MLQVSVAFLGPAGTYSEEAAEAYFTSDVTLTACDSIEDICVDVRQGRCQYGVLPLENSTEGPVARSLDLLYEIGPAMIGEVVLPIRHQVMNRSGRIGDALTIYAHEQALAQCRRWLSSLPHKPALKAVASNGLAARMAADDDRCAAIASVRAAQRLGLKILHSDIQDHPHNRTRFAVIASHGATEPSGDDCTSMIASLANEPGTLLSLLSPFAAQDLSILHLEVRPARQAGWKYRFYIDVTGHQQDASVRTALAQASAIADELVVLGSYKRAAL